VIKIPLVREGLTAIATLRQDGIPTAATLVFSPGQALLAAKAGASLLIPFVGRLDDAGHYGMEVISQIVSIFDNYDFGTQIIVGSVRNPLHVVDAALIGAHGVTVPLKVIQQMIRHPLTDIGVERFLDDWRKLGTEI
jgi:transaldolase